MIPSRVSMRRKFRLPNRAALDALLTRRDNEAIDEDAGRMNAFRVEISGLDELLDFRDRDPSRRDGHRVEVAGGFPINEVSQAIALPRRDEREVPHDALLEQVLAAVEDASLLSLRHQSAHAGRSVESRDPRASRAHPLGERPLGHELHFQLPAQELPLEFRVLSHVGGHHPADLPGLQEQAQPPVIHAAVVRDGGQVLDPPAHESRDQVLRNSAESESTDDERGAIEDIPHCLVGRSDELVDHRSR
jgi:hypothetical protein